MAFKWGWGRAESRPKAEPKSEPESKPIGGPESEQLAEPQPESVEVTLVSFQESPQNTPSISGTDSQISIDTAPRRGKAMKTVLTFASGASVPVTVGDLETSFPGRVQPVPAIDGVPLSVGQSVQLQLGITLSVLADDPAPETVAPAAPQEP